MNISLNIGHTPNYAMVKVNDLILHFSYETVIGFVTPETGLVVRENIYGTTTGKHLNRLQPDKAKRIPSVTFEAQLAQVTERKGN